MSRQKAIDAINRYFESGAYFSELQQRIAIPSESQTPKGIPAQHCYLDQQMLPLLVEMGFQCQKYANPAAPTDYPDQWPLLIAERIEDPSQLTVLMYGHGDVVRGYDAEWQDGLSPWQLLQKDDRWYGRGTADNKGQHSINLAALRHLLHEKQGHLGFNVKLIIEMGEEAGSPGLADFCRYHRDLLRADLFIGSDGPRIAAQNPTVFLGARGSFNFELRVKLRSGAHHSGNWGGLLANAGTRLTHAWASMIDAHGRILVPALLPSPIPAAVKEAIRHIQVGQDPNAPAIDPSWGEPGLTPAERVLGWNTLELLACVAGNPTAPANAIPGEACLYGQIRYVVGSDDRHFADHIRQHLDQHGFTDVTVHPSHSNQMLATRLDPEDPWVNWALSSIQNTTQKAPVLLPNLGGSLPNDVFACILGLPTLWVPHSYPSCNQHAPDEHVLPELTQEALQLMTGLFWDLAEEGAHIAQLRQHSHHNRRHQLMQED